MTNDENKDTINKFEFISYINQIFKHMFNIANNNNNIDLKNETDFFSIMRFITKNNDEFYYNTIEKLVKDFGEQEVYDKLVDLFDKYSKLKTIKENNSSNIFNQRLEKLKEYFPKVYEAVINTTEEERKARQEEIFKDIEKRCGARPVIDHITYSIYEN